MRVKTFGKCPLCGDVTEFVGANIECCQNPKCNWQGGGDMAALQELGDLPPGCPICQSELITDKKGNVRCPAKFCKYESRS